MTALAATSMGLVAFSQAEGQSAEDSRVAWYRRTLRWGQTNITEKDPVRYDIGWWPAQFLVSGASQSLAVNQGWVTFELRSLLDHELVVIT